MTKREKAYIQRIVDHFDFHNKNMTKSQDWQIYKLKKLLKGKFIED